MSAPTIGGVSVRSRNGAASRTGSVVKGPATQTSPPSPLPQRYHFCFVKQTAGGGTSKTTADKLETDDASFGASPSVNGNESASSPPSSASSAAKGGGGNSDDGQKKRKMSNKEKFEFADLEKVIDDLSARGKELEVLLEGAQAAKGGWEKKSRRRSDPPPPKITRSNDYFACGHALIYQVGRLLKGCRYGVNLAYAFSETYVGQNKR